MRTIYQAEDGKLFSSREECLRYENNYIDINYSAKITITFYSEDILYNVDKRKIENGDIVELIKENLLCNVYTLEDTVAKGNFKIEELYFKPSL